LAAYANPENDHTGLWKINCNDGFGVQIRPIDNKLYSISFCGPGGCFEPGTWEPNSSIDGDPTYKILSPTQIGIARKDTNDYFIYSKCASDPTWHLAKQTPAKPDSEEQLDCSLQSNHDKSGVLIAWVTDYRETSQFGSGISEKTTTVEPFRPMLILSGSSLKETSGAEIFKNQSFWPVLSPDSLPVKLNSVGSFLDHMNTDHCVYFGTLTIDMPKWTLLSNKPLPGVFHTPTPAQSKEFYQLNTSCVQQGDYPDTQNHPCTRPKLLAISDINKNGKLEFWATEPYIWDTGLTVWENTGSLIPILQLCSGCSD